MKFLCNDDDTCIEATCFDSEPTVEFAKLKTERYMVFTMAVNPICPARVTAKDGEWMTAQITVKDKTLKGLLTFYSCHM